MSTSQQTYPGAQGKPIAGADLPALTGDVTTVGAAATVVQMRGKAIAASVGTAGVGQDGYILSWQNGNNDIELVAPSAVSGLSADKIRAKNVSTRAPLVGDTLVFDGTNWVPTTPFLYRPMKAVIVNAPSWGTFDGTPTGPSVSAGSTNSVIAATATDAPMLRSATGALADTIAYGTSWHQSGSINYFTLGCIKHLLIRARMNQSTNVRYWIGHAYSAGGAPGTTTFGTDTPAAFFVGFRYSSGTDATIKCVCQTDSTHQTVVDSTISVDTVNTKDFEVVWDGTNVNFYINSTRVAQISTNVPATTQGLGCLILVDNKSTANVRSVDCGYISWVVV